MTPARATTSPSGLGSQLDEIRTQAHAFATPRVATFGMIALLAALALFWAVAEGLYREARSGVQTIGRDTAPSIVAAQQIRADLADLAANAANAALTHGTSSQKAWAAFDKDGAKLADHLISASQNITYGEEERGPILRIQVALQNYVGLIGEARAIMDASRDDRAPAPALDRIARATRIMNASLLPAAQALNDANERVLDAAWDSRQRAFRIDAAGLLVSALPAIGVLVYLSYLLSNRTRRILNPGLLAALILLLGGALFCSISVGSSNAALTRAKSDAFDSVRAIWKARSVAYIANGAESFYLLDPAGANQQDKVFVDRIRELIGPVYPNGSPLPDVARFVNSRCSGNGGFKGLLGAELNNVTFYGECEAAGVAYRTLDAYLQIDKTIRSYEQTGRHAEAVALCVGTWSGESNWAFDKFDDALTSLIDINQGEFDNNIALAERRLAGLPIVIAIIALLSAVCGFFGLRRVSAEYRV